MTIHPSHKYRSLLATTGLFASLLVSSVAHAQGNKKAVAEIPVKAEPAKVEAAAAAPRTSNADSQQTKVKVERGAGGKKVYKIEGEIVIEGKIQKPEAFYVLQKIRHKLRLARAETGVRAQDSGQCDESAILGRLTTEGTTPWRRRKRPQHREPADPPPGSLVFSASGSSRAAGSLKSA